MGDSASIPFRGRRRFTVRPPRGSGGGALYVGILAAAAVSASPARGLLLALGISSLAGFAAGMVEDLSKKTPPTLRLLGTILSGLIYCILTGYAVTRLDFPLIDGFMSLPLISIAFTVFVMAGLANAMNIIDGCHGLAAGTAVIMLCALGTLAFLVEDHDLALVALVVAAARQLPVGQFSVRIHLPGRWRSVSDRSDDRWPGGNARGAKSRSIGMGRRRSPGLSGNRDSVFDCPKNDSERPWPKPAG